ncbi:exodeoxyribonuclease VII large subunit [Thioclava sp. SK-1]|uniref:exodeoxyribonuclease VII large subunit n=1 Tax=Thioclava sp. SK-1 TaxID=1889770 RepID=UPI00082689BD|nr:exodeoxyribonuclease VII large subunit [Thioclava sp. SK-1]OCX66022.1 exodeoxyribonuclease VII large subunit [Thioclava sp. SK-1]
MELFEDDTPQPGGNAHDYTVSEISGSVKRVLEGEFGRVRVRGEVGRVSVPRSGHMYFDLKDDRAVIAAVSWKGQVSKMQVRPEEGMEVIASGRLTTFPGQSKYQLIVDTVEPAGAGALMAMLEARKRALAAEGLFADDLKQALPWLPGVIGVVTSPSGAVIRDILHRLRDRFPRHVLIWPVAVQGQSCAPDVARAIRGFNAMAPGGPLPRPELIIVARGGGSIEDLWGFNEEIVVRAAAESAIPLISAVGHETDTTLIDFASDRRAPTPTAAAEMAVPVRRDLAIWLGEAQTRMRRAIRSRIDAWRQRHSDLARALGRPDALIAPAQQRFDLWAERLNPALRSASLRNRASFTALEARMSPGFLSRYLANESRQIVTLSQRFKAAKLRNLQQARKSHADAQAKIADLSQRMVRSQKNQLGQLHEQVRQLEQMRQTLGYSETLKRGYAIVRSGDQLVTSSAVASAAKTLELEFADGRVVIDAGGRSAAPKATAKPRKSPKANPDEDAGDQGSLF